MKPTIAPLLASVWKSALPIGLALLITATAALPQQNRSAVLSRRGVPRAEPRALPPGGAAVKTTSPLQLLRAFTRDEVVSRRKAYPTAVGQNRSLPSKSPRGNWLQN